MLHATLLPLLYFYDFVRSAATFTPTYVIYVVRLDYQLAINCVKYLKRAKRSRSRSRSSRSFTQLRTIMQPKAVEVSKTVKYL